MGHSEERSDGEPTVLLPRDSSRLLGMTEVQARRGLTSESPDPRRAAALPASVVPESGAQGARCLDPSPPAADDSAALPVHEPLETRQPQDALRWGAGQLRACGVASFARDARILLRQVLACSEEALAGGAIAELTVPQVLAFRRLIARRRQGEPIAYICGKKAFMGLEFTVDRRVLIPRPETELLVEQALAFVSGDTQNLAGETGRRKGRDLLLADIGAGSGAIAIALAKQLPCVRVYATDISADALAVARENCALHGVTERITLLRGSYLDALLEPAHVVVCNPPYIPTGDIAGLARDVRDYEPHVALAGGEDGLEPYRALFAGLPAALLPGGAAFFEIGYDMAARLQRLAAALLPGAVCEVFPDLAGFDRVLRIAQVAPNRAKPRGEERQTQPSPSER